MRNFSKQLGIVSSILAVIVPVLVWLHNVAYIPYLREQIKGGLGEELAAEFKVPKEDVPELLKESLDKTNFLFDSANTVKGIYKPFLDKQIRTIDVGLKIDIQTGKEKYLAPDGEEHHVLKIDTGANKGRRYYIDNIGKSYWIYENF